jgi:hypothetical protein
MKSQSEIQRAHDLISPVLTGEMHVTFEGDTSRLLRAACDVLCWVLDHDHNQNFAINLTAIEAELLKAGFVLENRGN